MSRVVVVGAGIVGASTAYHLSCRNADVTLVELGRPAGGATGSSFAWISRHGQSPGSSDSLRADAVVHWRRVQQELPEVHVSWSGSLRWGDDPTEAVVRAGPDRQQLSAAEAATLEPNLRVPPANAVHTSSDGVIDPRAVTEALVRAAGERGARVLLDTAVNSLRMDGARVLGVDTVDRFVPADVVVLAAGTAVPALCAPLGVHVPVSPSPAALVEVEAGAGLVHTLVSSPAVELREVPGCLLVAADWDADGSPDQAAQLATTTAAAVTATFGTSEALGPARVRVGLRPMPADGAPIIGPVADITGLYLAVMHSGVTLAPLVGQLVAGEIVDGVEALALREFRLARFTARSA